MELCATGVLGGHELNLPLGWFRDDRPAAAAAVAATAAAAPALAAAAAAAAATAAVSY